MFVAYRHAEKRIVDFLAESGFGDITLAQGRIAARLSEDGLRLTELAEQAQVTKQTAGFLVDQLEAAGYVERVPDPSDARARLIRLAPRGRQVQRRARVMERRIEAEWERHLGAERMADLHASLADLREITDPYR
ncbi:MAG: MarR family transcriptional regulator [Nocardioidaceae bacterium]|nr:MarR family transcriptional regulator [Nocardioidaceae bacterium]